MGFYPVNKATLERDQDAPRDRALLARVFDDVTRQWTERRFPWDEVPIAAAWIAIELGRREM